MHEDPQVPNFVSSQRKRHAFRIEPVLVVAIEPMGNAGTKNVRVLKDHWTVETKDKKPSDHFEHTVAITENGPEILTPPENKDRRNRDQPETREWRPCEDDGPRPLSPGS